MVYTEQSKSTTTRTERQRNVTQNWLFADLKRRFIVRVSVWPSIVAVTTIEYPFELYIVMNRLPQGGFGGGAGAGEKGGQGGGFGGGEGCGGEGWWRWSQSVQSVPIAQ